MIPVRTGSTAVRRALVVSSRRTIVGGIARRQQVVVGAAFGATSSWNPMSLTTIQASTNATPVPRTFATLGVGANKTSTGYVGLAVEPDWYNVILKKFQALLDKMETSDMPVTAQYRIDVTKWCNYVVKATKENPTNPEAVEDAVNMGQVEELIDMADDEMICLDVYLKTRMWEHVAEANPDIDFSPDPTKDPMSADGNTAVHDALRQGMEQRK